MDSAQEMIVTEDGDVTITAGSELVEASHHAGQEFLWGYYFCIENNSDQKITLLGKIGILPMTAAVVFAMTPTVSAARSPSWNRVNILNSAPPRRLKPLMRFSTAVAKF